jgi:hypothetical protein
MGMAVIVLRREGHREKIQASLYLVPTRFIDIPFDLHMRGSEKAQIH